MFYIFFDKSKIPTSVLCRTPLETFIPNLVLIGRVSFENLLMMTMEDDKYQVMAIAHLAIGQVS